MRLTCSCCGAHGSIELFTSDELARRFSELLSELPAGLSASVARRYIALFRPKQRGLSWDRACALMGEVKHMAETGGVWLNNQRYPASPNLLTVAMQQMLDKPAGLVLPLKTHGYLLTIIASGSVVEQLRIEQQINQHKTEESVKRHREVYDHGERMRREYEEEQRLLGRKAAEAGSKPS
jgi:hypothetical protein